MKTNGENNVPNNQSNKIILEFTLTIDFSKAQKAFKYGDLVYVIDSQDANRGLYGSIANHTRLLRMTNLREDWLEKLVSNNQFEPENLVVDFGGGHGDQWSKLYHVSQIVNVRLLGQNVLTEYQSQNKAKE